jgi:hypothetical protein
VFKQRFLIAMFLAVFCLSLVGCGDSAPTTAPAPDPNQKQGKKGLQKPPPIEP